MDRSKHLVQTPCIEEMEVREAPKGEATWQSQLSSQFWDGRDPKYDSLGIRIVFIPERLQGPKGILSTESHPTALPHTCPFFCPDSALVTLTPAELVLGDMP